MQYRPIENEDKDYTITPVTLGAYKKIKILQLKNSSTPKQHKMNIIEEFLITQDEINNMEIINIEKFYQEIVKVLFLEKPKGLEINIQEVNRAITDFFGKVSGN